MKNFFVLLLIAGAAVIGGKFYFEHQYRKELDNAIALARPYVEVQYTKLEIGVDGSLLLHGLSVAPRESDQLVTIRSIKFMSSDRLGIIKGTGLFDNAQYPDAFSVAIDNIEFDSTIFGQIPDKEQCRSFDTSFIYDKIGLERILADMSIAFDFSDTYNSTMELVYVDDVGSFDLQATFDVDLVPGAVVGEEQAPLSDVVFSASLDEVVAKSAIAYCAERFKVTEDNFILKVVGSSKYAQNTFGVDLGAEARKALMKFMQGGSQIRVNSKPNKELLKIENLSSYKAREVVGWLNLTVNIDEKLVPIVVAKPAPVPDVRQARAKRKAKNRGKYVVVNKSNVRQYLDRDIRVSRTRGRSSIRGRLMSSAKNILTVEAVHLTGGITYNIPMTDIVKLEIYQ